MGIETQHSFLIVREVKIPGKTISYVFFSLNNDGHIQFLFSASKRKEDY